MTTILAANGFAHIGRRSELGPDDGMRFRRSVIRSDEAWLSRSRSARPRGVSGVRPPPAGDGERSDRAVGTNGLLAEIRRVYKANYACYRFAAGLQTMVREGNRVARCTVEG